MDKNLNNLLKWSIENSAPSTGVTAVDSNTSSGPQEQSTRTLDPEILAALLGGPSEAELMRAAMEVITDPTTDLDNKLIAFDNFEQLIESLDNANNLEPLALWSPLISLLGHEEQELRRMAAWCVGTAVQNNVRSQERLLAMGGIPHLVGLATREEEPAPVRRKAIYALSSAVRNYQPAMDVATAELKKNGQDHGKGDKVDATDMNLVDEIMEWLKQRVAEAAKV
ncbi:hsp70 nucleotide exchange factor fes1 [Madurella fahalii]|uniref:Hsp70 nucleotide exchange factor fes1 n=1 Tax=Madurella fahalii TaxID=1157608 RepID=A0ABQ0GB98_9PEZI